MRIFNTIQAPKPTSAKSINDVPDEGTYVDSTGLGQDRGPRRLIKREGPSNQPYKSDMEIREQLMQSTDILRKKKVAVEKKNAMTKSSSTYMQETKGDVGRNDPTSDITVGKLKDLVSSGGFSFNDKERSVLEEILSKR